MIDWAKRKTTFPLYILFLCYPKTSLLLLLKYWRKACKEWKIAFFYWLILTYKDDRTRWILSYNFEISKFTSPFKLVIWRTIYWGLHVCKQIEGRGLENRQIFMNSTLSILLNHLCLQQCTAIKIKTFYPQNSIL